MQTRGFTIVELIITITIMGILLTLAVVGLGTTQVKSRDDERTIDVEVIQTNLESVYTAGVASSDTIPTNTNLIINPSFETNTTGWVGSCGATSITRVTTEDYIGAASVRLNTTGASQCMYAAPFITSGAGRTYTMSAYVKGEGSAQISIGAQPGGAIVAISSPKTLSSAYWQRITITGTTGSGVTDVYPVLWQSDTGTKSMYIDAIIATETSYLTDYADGTSQEWGWTGSAHASTSLGPIVPVAIPGYYPGTSLVNDALRTIYLPNADPKAFLPPGQTDPATTFIPATNAVQTTSGVLPQPTTNQYVYQPIDSNGGLCNDFTCRKYNIYYRLEEGSVVQMVTSKNQ